MNLTSIFGLKKPQATDPAIPYTDITDNAVITENALKSGIAIQNNSSGTLYTSDFPLKEYVNGHNFVFIPIVTCAGAVTINFNGLGVKKIFDILGTTQLSIYSDFRAFSQYLITYDSTLDGGIGAFKSISLNKSTVYTSGSATYSDVVPTPAGTTITKYISIPSTANYGEMLIHNSSSSTVGLFIKFGKDGSKTLSVGTSSANYGGASVKGDNGSVSLGNGSISSNPSPAGDGATRIKDIYINNSSQIVIVFENSNGNFATAINCKLNYEVWER